MTTFQENFARELTNPNGWDIAGAGAASFEEFFKELVKPPVQATVISAGRER